MVPAMPRSRLRAAPRVEDIPDVGAKVDDLGKHMNAGVRSSGSVQFGYRFAGTSSAGLANVTGHCLRILLFLQFAILRPVVLER